MAAHFAEMSGLLPINKPSGMGSKDVSRWLEKRVGKIKLGHVGTLDPLAAGVLPILIGRATRLQDFLLDQPKQYLFDVQFGLSTDTLDMDGCIVDRMSYDDVSAESIEKSLLNFAGTTSQIPPLFSAIKYRGRPLYEYARKNEGDKVPLASLQRQVMMSDLELLRYEAPIATLRLTCSRGTFVRSFARDLAATMGTCGTIASLTRTQTAGIRIEQSWTLEELEPKLENLPSLITPMDQIVKSLPCWRASDPQWVQRLRQGQELILNGDVFSKGYLAQGDQTLRQSELSVVILGARDQPLGLGLVQTSENLVSLTMKRGLHS